MADSTVNIPISVPERLSEAQDKIMEASYIWTIKNFSFHLNDSVIISPVFSAEADDDSRWCLMMFPSDENTNDPNESWMSLFLKLRSCRGREALTKFKISLLNADHEVIHRSFLHEPRTLRGGQALGTKYFIRRDHLYMNHRVPGDKLTVFCDVSYIVDTVPSAKSRIDLEFSEKVALANLGELYESKVLSDVVLVVNGKEFHAHKAILAARSTGFKSMFEQDCGGLKTSRVEISYIDEERLEDLLRFIYTGEAKGPIRRLNALLAAIGDYSVAKTTSMTGSPEENSRGAATTIDQTHGASWIQTTSPNQDKSGWHEIDVENRKPLGRPRLDEVSLGMQPKIVKDRFFGINKASSGTKTLAPGSPSEGSTVTAGVAKRPQGRSGLTLPYRISKPKPVDLPLVNMEKFDAKRGNFRRWWSDFKENVHDRRDLSIAQKFVYLRDLLEGEAANAIIDKDEKTSAGLAYVRTIENIIDLYGFHRNEELRPSVEHSHLIQSTDEKQQTELVADMRSKAPQSGASENGDVCKNPSEESYDAFEVILDSATPEKLDEESTHAEVLESGRSCKDSNLSSGCDSELLSVAEGNARLPRDDSCAKCAGHEHTDDNSCLLIRCRSPDEENHDALCSSSSTFSSIINDDEDDSLTSSFSVASM